MKLPHDGDNELWRELFNVITLKVIVEVRKVRLAHFHIFIFLNRSIEVLPKCSKILMVLIDFKGYFQGLKGPIWTFVFYLGRYLRNGAYCDQCLYEAHI